jgi:hypothetical protein
LHLNAFLLDGSNTATGGVAYFWEQDKTVNSHTLINYKGGYGSYSPVDLVSSGVYVPATFNSYNPNGSLNTTGLSSGLLINRQYAPIGQGFVISATANGTATFKNSHRVFIKENTSGSQFEKHVPKLNNSKEASSKEADTQEVSHFKLNTIINNQFTRQLTNQIANKRFYIIQDNANSILKASNPNNLALKSFKLYDIAGKLLLSKKELGAEQNYIFSTTGLSSGVYIAEFLTTDNERWTEKIIISNSRK